MAETSNQQRIARRQRIVLLTGLGLLAAYFFFLRIASNSLGTGVALCAAFGFILVAIGVAAVFNAPTRRRAAGRLLIATILVGVVVVGCWPGIQRASRVRALEAAGARVVTTTDAGDGVWFQYGWIYLPCWLKIQLGDGFFGRIEEVDWSDRRLSMEGLNESWIPEQIVTLNLSSADVNGEDFARLSDQFDAHQVLVNSLDLSVESLSVLASMPSLRRIAAVDTTITKQEAIEFAGRHPWIQLIHGDSENGYGFVAPPPATPAR